MTKKEIIAGNKLIAEFMGCHFKYIRVIKDKIVLKDKLNGCHVLSESEYHSSWGWLMPALRKFDLINYNDFPKYKNKQLEELFESNDNAVTLYEIEGAWKSLVRAIKWYNKNINNG